MAHYGSDGNRSGKEEWSPLRLKRLSESPDKNHTFKPQLIASNDGASSRLPVGARARDTAALPLGTYDLSALETMEDAFPPITTPHMVYRDINNVDTSEIRETRDSLDRRLDLSTSRIRGNQRHFRREVVDVKEENFRRGPTQSDPGSISRDGVSRRGDVRVDGRSASGGALSHEVDRRLNVRELLGEPPHRLSKRNSHSSGTMATSSLQRHNGYRETVEGVVHPSELLLANGNGRGRGVAHRGRYIECVPEGEGADASEEEAFERSLRGRAAGVRRSGVGGSKRDGRRVVRRPEWNSDTVGAGYLDSFRAVIMTDNSPVAVERRVAARQRQSSHREADSRSSGYGDDNIYGYDGYRNCDSSSNGYSDGNKGGNISAAWKHEHTKTLPVGEGRREDADSLAIKKDFGRGGIRGRGEEISSPGFPPPRKGREELSQAGRSKRDGYRCQMMAPSSTTGSLPREFVEPDGLPSEEDQLRRNLSLLKKKMLSTRSGSRRTQSARTRLGEVSGEADAPDAANDADHRYTDNSRTRLQNTSGSAHATMTTRCSASTRPMSMMTEVSRSDESSATPMSAYGLRSRPPPPPSISLAEGPGSPYTVHHDSREQDHHRSYNRHIPIGTTKTRNSSQPSVVDDKFDRRSAWGAVADDEDVSTAVLPENAYPRGGLELRECTVCGRKFNPDALERHSRVCEASFRVKRKVFNTSEMRMKGPEIEKFTLNKSKGENRGKNRVQVTRRGFDDTPVGGNGTSGKTSKWRQQSSQFREAIRQARVVTKALREGKSLAELPPLEPSTPDPSLVPCPHCGRRFNQTAGERHMKHCQNIKAKPSTLKKGSGSLLGQAARQKSSKSVSRGQRW